MKPNIEISAKLLSQGVLLQSAAAEELTISAALWTFLQESEVQLINLMTGNPLPPDAPGNFEFSWVLYVFNNDVPGIITDALRKLGMPASQITTAQWAGWETTWSAQGVVYGDGTLVNTAPYAMLDPGWTIAFVDYILLHLGKIKTSPFGTTPATLDITGKPTLSVALFGDWGTGAYQDGNLPASPSQLIAQQLKNIAPDISIHLGDVYYAGHPDEEQNNLVNCWPAGSLGNFALNSNHEMYYGAQGLFDTAYTSAALAGQQHTSYFQVEFGNWLIVGLDTAYFDTSFLFMDGAITDGNQLAFLNKAAQSGKNIVLLTHHNPIDITGASIVGPPTNNLLSQVTGALNSNPPKYWYWGHQHNGVVYTGESKGGKILCRCLGNAAIPIGNAAWLHNNPNVSFYTNKPLANPTTNQQLRVMNGFAVLEFTENDVTEKWYYEDGSSVNIVPETAKESMAIGV